LPWQLGVKFWQMHLMLSQQQVKIPGQSNYELVRYWVCAIQ